MKIINTFKLSFAFAAVLFFAGCATHLVGSSQSDTPPRLVKDGEGKVIWNNSALFGPVPAELLAAGTKNCSQLDSKDAKHEARGYHAKALSLDGRPFVGGGYFCVQK